MNAGAVVATWTTDLDEVAALLDLEAWRGDDWTWRRRALCAQPDMVALWDACTAKGGAIALDDPRSKARHMCLWHCPVVRQCFAAAVAERPIETVQGGLIWTRARKGSQDGVPTSNQPDAGHGGHCLDLRIREAGPVTGPTCPDPTGHARLERGPAQEHRPPPQRTDGRCDWCGFRIAGYLPVVVDEADRVALDRMADEVARRRAAWEEARTR